MNDSHISGRYAKALFKSARDMDLIDKISGDMDLINEICRVKDFMNMIETPSVSTEQKRSVILDILKDKINPLTEGLIKLVMENKRETYLPAIARNYKAIYKNFKGIKTASLVTATKLEDKMVKKIRDLIIKTYDAKVDLTTEVDETLIGGFILTIEDRQYDASISSGLKKIKKQLLETSVIKI
jgi:F-type H+-transporting ATPase subunit delta